MKFLVCPEERRGWHRTKYILVLDNLFPEQRFGHILYNFFFYRVYAEMNSGMSSKA